MFSKINEKDEQILKENFKNREFSLSSVAIIDIFAIKSNILTLKSKIKGKFCAVVKSDAYGHGMEIVSREIESLVDMFAVATIEEGIRLRLCGIKKNILIFLPTKNFKKALFYDLTISVGSEEEIKELIQFSMSNRGEKQNKFYISVNSGMNRMGISTFKELFNIVNNLKKCRIFPSGIYSHFYSDNKKNCQKQYEKFKVYSDFLKKNFKNITSSICSSSQISLNDDFHMDLVRVGLAMYGYSTINSTFKLKKAMKIYGKVIKSRNLSKNDHFLYDPFVLNKNLKLSISAFGYDSGFLFGENLVNRCCMNVCGSKFIGNNFTLIADDMDKYAKINHTITYNALCILGKSSQKIYKGALYEGCFRKI